MFQVTEDLAWSRWVAAQLVLKNWKRQDLADALGVSRTTLWRALSDEGGSLRERIEAALTP